MNMNETVKHKCDTCGAIFMNFPELCFHIESLHFHSPQPPPFKYKSDPVAHPSHYNSGTIEVIEAIEDWKLGMHLGNAIKYIARAGKKDPAKEIEDLKKAIWYVNRYIEVTEAAAADRETVKPDDMKPSFD